MRDFLLLSWPQTSSFQGYEDFTVYCTTVTAKCDTSLEQSLAGSVVLEAQLCAVSHLELFGQSAIIP